MNKPMHIIFKLLNHNICQFGWFRGSLDHMKKKSDGVVFGKHWGEIMHVKENEKIGGRGG